MKIWQRRSGEEEALSAEERYYVATQWQLMWRRLKKHKLALGGIAVLFAAYFCAFFAEFVASEDIYKRHVAYMYCPPQRIHVLHDGSPQRPFVYGLKSFRDPVTFERLYHEDRSHRYPIRLFVDGYSEYEMWGMFSSKLRLFGVDAPGVYFPFGTDKLGRDIYSRTIHAARISLSIGFLGVALSFVLGCVLGGISGYYGGAPDMVIQRMIEFLLSIPTIPLWMALAAAVPPEWPPLHTYFAITMILSMIGWCGLARVVRGKLISLREEDFVLAALVAGASSASIIRRHLLPAFLSYLIVNLTLAIPGMILGETALSFLGLGLRAPVVSWGVLLSDAQDVKVVLLYPWLLIPGLLIILVVLAFNFLGDGLRDAADPYR
jgi:peptide/nickel transport system permease protein